MRFSIPCILGTYAISPQKLKETFRTEEKICGMINRILEGEVAEGMFDVGIPSTMYYRGRDIMSNNRHLGKHLGKCLYIEGHMFCSEILIKENRKKLLDIQSLIDKTKYKLIKF